VRVVPAHLLRLAPARLDQTELTLWFRLPDSQHKPQSAAVPERKCPSETMAVLAVAVAVVLTEFQAELLAKETLVAEAQPEHLMETDIGSVEPVVEPALRQRLQQALPLVASVALVRA
jgi:hypothetical protein